MPTKPVPVGSPAAIVRAKPQVSQLPSEPSPPTSVVQPLLAAVLLALFWMYIPRTVITPQLDASWSAVLGYAHAHGLQFGSQIVFPHGPLSFLLVPDYNGHWIPARLLLGGLLCYVGAAGITLLAWRMTLGWRVLLLAFVLVSPANIRNEQVACEIAVVCWGLLALTDQQRAVRWSLITALLVGVLGLVKFGLLLGGLVTLAAVMIDQIWRGRPRMAAWVAAVAGTVFLAGWILLGQSLRNLFPYALNSLAVASGFNLAMAQSANRDIRLAAVLTVMITLSAVVLRSFTAAANGQVLPARRRWLLAGWLMIQVLLNWKYGLVRADGHIVIFLGFAGVLTLGLEVVEATTRWAQLTARYAAVVVFLLACVTAEWMFPGVMSLPVDRAFRRLSNNLRVLARPSVYKREMDAKLALERRRDQLPQMRQRLGQATVDIFGQNQGYAIFNDFNYHPRPVFQSYCAYSARLDGLNEAYYSGTQAPDFVLFNLSPIDERWPTSEDSGALRALLSRYQLIDGEGLFLLFERSGTRPALPVLLHEAGATLGERIPLPQSTGAELWMEIDLRASLAGQARRFFYQPPRIDLCCWINDPPMPGPAFSAPAPMLHAGFIARPLLRNNFDIVDFCAGMSNLCPVALSVEVKPRDRQFYQSSFHYRLYQLPLGFGWKRDATLARLKWPGFHSFPFEAVSSPNPVALTILEGKPAIRVPAPGNLKFVLAPGATNISGAYGFEQDAYTIGTTDGAEFRIEGQNEDGSSRLLFSELLQPKSNPADRGLHAFSIRLPAEVRGPLLLSVLPGPRNDTAWDLGCWANIEIR